MLQMSLEVEQCRRGLVIFGLQMMLDMSAAAKAVCIPSFHQTAVVDAPLCVCYMIQSRALVVALVLP